MRIDLIMADAGFRRFVISNDGGLKYDSLFLYHLGLIELRECQLRRREAVAVKGWTLTSEID